MLDLGAPLEEEDAVGVPTLANVAGMGPSGTFVDLFCACTPYIKMHQGKTVVIHIASQARRVLRNPENRQSVGNK